MVRNEPRCLNKTSARQKDCDEGKIDPLSRICDVGLTDREKEEREARRREEARKEEEREARRREEARKEGEARNRRFCKEEWVRFEHNRGKDISECLKIFGLKPT